MNNLSGLDLNLLKTLDVLLSERNVTRAARRLHLSQPSVSVQLARLRTHFNDPLLIPAPRGMIPTAHAEALQMALHEALDTLSRAISPPPEFDPARISLTWRVAASDYGESTILLPVLDRLRQQAPNTRLAIMEMIPSRVGLTLSQGELDISFMTREEAPEGLKQRVIFTDNYVLAGRADHPCLTDSLSREQFSKLEHVVVSQEGGGFSGVTDNALKQVGLSRHVALSVPHFLFVPAALQYSDMVAMLPSRLVKLHPFLRVIPAPVEVPDFEMLMVWHERLHHDAAHQWLRSQIMLAAS